MNKSTILVTCGGIAGDIRQELGPARSQVKKVHHGDPVGSYGDFIFRVSENDAVRMMLKYPHAVEIIP
ncbi:hypothetical protein M2323_003562 [Rhodoblastus acidophilus]|uniref:hypothetical protein n=1 Tax=Rhodoblastus acidophilus TaxID=1074 RepID=UPI002225378D|nr:hypothetical protein [Rhodoblastus acidophilus]MCW2285621.1 hypothetical protein [Rhodoblastus acidophilus]MCW2334621.1 hypothetical protein [Rhodoblastus acidophilus]